MKDKADFLINIADEVYESNRNIGNNNLDKLKESAVNYTQIYPSIEEMGEIYKHSAFKNFIFNNEKIRISKDSFSDEGTNISVFTHARGNGIRVSGGIGENLYIDVTMKIVMQDGTNNPNVWITFLDETVQISRIHRDKVINSFEFSYEELKECPYQEVPDDGLSVYYASEDNRDRVRQDTANFLRSDNLIEYIVRTEHFISEFESTETNFYEQAEKYIKSKKKEYIEY